MAENMLLIWHRLTCDQQEFLYNNLTSGRDSKRKGMPKGYMPFIPLIEMLDAHDRFMLHAEHLFTLLKLKNCEALNIRRKLEE